MTDTTPIPLADLTVADLVVRFVRAPSTVRGWLEAGRFEGAWKLNGRDWRVAPAAVETFLARERARHAGRAPDLGVWRQYRRNGR